MKKPSDNFQKTDDKRRKLTIGQALFIRSVRHKIPMRELARHFNVSVPVIRDVQRGATYREIVMTTEARVDFMVACHQFKTYPTPRYEA